MVLCSSSWIRSCCAVGRVDGNLACYSSTIVAGELHLLCLDIRTSIPHSSTRCFMRSM